MSVNLDFRCRSPHAEVVGHYFVLVATHGLPLELVYMMVWRCGGTYLWIYWCTKEMNIEDFFLLI
jgi:hypothetical protein